MSEPNVTATLTIKGKDDASAALRSATTSANGLSGALKRASTAGEGLASSLRQAVSGDVLGTLRSLQGAIGAEGLAGAAGLAATGISGIAIAIGAAAVKTTEWSIELERLRAQMEFAAGSTEAVFAVAQAIGGVGVESVVKLQATLKQSGAEGEITIKQLQALANAATTMGKTGDDALNAFADALRTGSTEGLTQIGVMVRGESAIAAYAKSVGKSTDALSAAERAQVILTAVQAEAAKVSQGGTDIHARQDSALSALSNRHKEFQLLLSQLVAGPAVRLMESLLSIIDGMSKAKDVTIAFGRLAIAPTMAILGALSKAVQAAGAALRGDFSAATTLAGEALLATAAPVVDSIRDIYRLSEATDDYAERAKNAAEFTAATGVAAEATSGKVGGLAYAFDIFTQGMREGHKAQTAFAVAAEAERKRQAKAASADAARRRAAAAALRTRLGAEFMTGLESDIEAQAARNLEIAKAEAQAAQEGARQYEAMRDRVLGVYAELATDPARKAALEIQQIEIDKARELAAVKEQMHLTSAQQAELSAAIEAQALERVRLKQVEVNQAVASQVQAWAGAGQAIAQALGVGDEAQRVSAGLQALVAGADAFKYAAAGNIPSAIASGAAALGYARAAVAPAPPLPGGGGAAQRAPVPAAATSTAPQGVTINLHGIATSKAEVGAGIAKALKAAKPTGFVPFGVPA